MLLVYAISEAPQDGWGSARTVALLAVSAALLVAFLVVETRSRRRCCRCGSSGCGRSPVANAVGFLLGGSFFAFIFIGTLYMQQVLGYSALKTGLAWLAASLTSVALAGLSQMLVTRISAEPVMAAGMAMIAGGMLWATQVPVHGHFWSDLARAVLRRRRRHGLRLHPDLDRRPDRRRRARGRARLGAAQHLPAARRRDRHRDRLDGRRHAISRPCSAKAQRPSAALTGGFHWALWVCGAIALLALPATGTLARRTTAPASLEGVSPALEAEKGTHRLEEVSQ